MSLEKWNERYRAGEQLFTEPTPLVTTYAGPLKPGTALDLACGAGRNAIYLAERGWRVTAVDGSPLAIDILKTRRKAEITTEVVDLELGNYPIPSQAFDLICTCYYLQRSLFPPMKAGVRPGGIVIAIVHLADPDQPQGTATRAFPGELRAFFDDWRILHYREGHPSESAHQRPVAELVTICEEPRRAPPTRPTIALPPPKSPRHPRS